MPVHGIFKLNRVSIMLQTWHLDFFATGKGWCSGDSCLDDHMFSVGRLSICAESCAAEQVFGGRHVPVAFTIFHNSFVSWDNRWMVCMYSSLMLVDVCCCCIKSSVSGIFVTSFHCFAITLIGQALWSRCVVNSLLCSMKSVLLVHILLYLRN